jgi:hypothetical protein
MTKFFKYITGSLFTIFLLSTLSLKAYALGPELVSLGNQNTIPNFYSFSSEKAVSNDARYIIFSSGASNLVPGFTPPVENGSIYFQVYMHDRVTGQTLPLSINSTGQPANQGAGNGKISNSGRYVLFDTTATNLGKDGNQQGCYIRDLQQNTTTVLTQGSSTCISMSDNDNYIALDAQQNPVPYFCPHSPCNWGDSKSWIYDRSNGHLQPVAMDSDGNYGQLRSDGIWDGYRASRMTMSGDAQVVAFGSPDKLTPQAPIGVSNKLYIRDFSTNTTQLLEGPNEAIDNFNTYAVVSGDGTKVVYISQDVDNTHYTNWWGTGQHRLYVRDLTTGNDLRVDVTPSGDPSNGNIYQPPSISDNGRYVAFLSTATNLTQSGGDTKQHAFVRDMQTGVTRQVDLDSNGLQANADAGPIQVLNDGSVQFSSPASNLVPAGTVTPQVYLSGPAKPAAPTNLSASSPSNAPHLIWNLVSNANSYTIYRDGQNIGFSGSTEYIDHSASDGSHVYSVTAKNTSNIEGDSSNTVTIVVDATSPEISYNFSSVANTNGWYNGNVTVNFTCSDNLSGVNTCSSPITVSTEGSNQAVTGMAMDNAGNSSLVTANVNIDKSLPMISYGTSTSQNQFGWFNTDVTLTFSYVDNISGLLSCQSPVTFNSEGLNQTVAGIAMDNAGNSAVVSANLNIDKTAPTLGVISWTNNPLQQGQNTVLSIPASDNLSGVQKVQYAVNGGASQAMAYDSATNTWQATFGANLTASTYTVNITATDFAGKASDVVTDVLAVYAPANGYVNGHAKTKPSATDMLPIALDTSKNPADLIIGFTNATAPTSGSFDVSYVIKQNKNSLSLSSTAINWVVVQDGTHASVLGHADMTTFVNGVQTVTQNVSVRFEIILGANGASDHITMKIYNPGTDPASGTPAYVVSDDVISNGSNLMIHP